MYLHASETREKKQKHPRPQNLFSILIVTLKSDHIVLTVRVTVAIHVLKSELQFELYPHPRPLKQKQLQKNNEKLTTQ